MRFKILLTGASGFLGNSIYQDIKHVYDVYTLARSNSDFNFDLTKSVPSFSTSFDYVIHSAGKAHVIPKTNIEKRQFFDVNVNGTINLLQGLEKNIKPKYFIYISSVSVYGLTEGLDIDENHSLDARDPYGKSKIDAENIILNWCNKNSVVCTIFRLPLIIGSNAPGNLNSMISAILNGYYFNISNGISKKSMVLNSDISKFMFDAAEVGGIYNLTDGCHPTFKELSNSIAMKYGKNQPHNIPFWFAFILAKIGDLIGDLWPLNTLKLEKIVSSLTFNDNRARKAFGWDPSPVLKYFNK